MLSRLTKTMAIAAVVTPLVTLVGMSPASAAGTATVAGTGTITPGLTTTCTPQTSIKFNGTAVVADPVDAGVYAIAFAGASIGCEDVTHGQGAGTLTGTGISGSGTYSRTGSAVTITGSGSINGHPHSITASCVFVPTGTPPITTYVLHCDVVINP